MRVIKKINNNVALCVDGNQKELIAFGRGIGFPVTPYEIKDLSKIEMTFYRIAPIYYALLSEIPEDIFEVAATLVSEAQKTLSCNLNPNLLISLADHINFAIVRLNKYKSLKMLFSYDVEQRYPKETALGRHAVSLIQKRLLISLPNSEITNIAMHFINAQEEIALDPINESIEVLIDRTLSIIERHFGVRPEKNTFQFDRFILHLRYYLKRIQDEKQFEDDNTDLLEPLKAEHPKTYTCSVEIAQLIDEMFHTDCTEAEILYLMIHSNRIVNAARAAK